ncbi:MAG: helix-hairpin-helix domain-containing protein [Methanobacteriaceae archaeon]|jgi:predicted DNA-binding helix-hairpin-helix protein|nr:helix-hairpin-helix domain-containing protein [Candidatus Methanorudis spinitermitis]
MNTMKKMQVLSDSAQYDLCDYVNYHKTSDANLPGIYHATGANGCKIPLFKVLMTNKCVNDCKYCINQSKRNFTRLELNPAELATVFLNYYNNSYVDGLFLSSGIANDIDNTMENVVEVARILRKDFGYSNYIHLKVIPGSSYDSIKRAMSLADRVSLNIEAASSDGLSEISSTKDYKKDIIRRLKWINSIGKRNPNFAKSGQTTQLIIGANNDSDFDVLEQIKSLYKKVNLKRSYFSSFSPVEGTEFENKEESNKKRASQLYHADALLNSYNFDVGELVFNDEGLLSLDEDPKYLAALEKDIFPLEINAANYHDLIRVPGVGTMSAKRIIAIRKKKQFQKMEELKTLGVVVKRAEPFIKIGGNYQTALDAY